MLFTFRAKLSSQFITFASYFASYHTFVVIHRFKLSIHLNTPPETTTRRGAKAIARLLLHLDLRNYNSLSDTHSLFSHGSDIRQAFYISNG